MCSTVKKGREGMGETVRPWVTAPGGPGSEVLESMDWANDREPDPPEMMPEPDHTKERRNEMYKPEDDEDEYANSMLWPAEGLREPEQPEQPVSGEAVVELAFLATGTTKQMKPYVDLTVDSEETGERFRVRTVKLYDELKDLQNGTRMRIKWFENGPFKNLVSAVVLSRSGTSGGSRQDSVRSVPDREKRPMAETVVLSAADPRMALDFLMFEWQRRTLFMWRRDDGSTVDVARMDNNELAKAISDMERAVEKEDAK